MRYGGFVLAYHGCDQSVGEKVLRGDADIVSSQNDYDWLGSGAYFWENSSARALKWAEFLRDRPVPGTSKVRIPFVVGAVIAPGNCLDLSEAVSLNVLRDAYEEYAAMMNASSAALPINEGGHPGDADLVKRKLDCAVINFLHTSREENGEPPFDTVRCPFFEGAPLFPGARVAERTHLQWSIRDPKKSVIGYYRPKSDAIAQ